MNIRRHILILICTLGQSTSSLSAELNWQPWTEDIFRQAKAENRFVLLDLKAVWCHWCHVMDEKTYGDARVRKILAEKYIAVRVDQDANPDLSNRYGDWGWPATIVFSADGQEIVKRRGYIPPVNMISMLDAIIKDPSPGPSVRFEEKPAPSATTFLTVRQRAAMVGTFDDAYDAKNAGWGRFHKFIHTESLDLEMARADRGISGAPNKVRETLDAALHLMDPVAGGLYQYSDTLDWMSPHYEKIMWYQANGLRHYSEAYARWQEPSYLDAANKIASYLVNVLRSPEGAFYTSQDADVDKKVSGKDYYAMDGLTREKLGRHPRIDRNQYARENGWAIRGLAAHFAATGNQVSLNAALRAAQWVLENRRLPDGGFSHGANDRRGPYLGPTLAMGRAALALYAANGERRWLTVAAEAGDYIAKNFQDRKGGGLLSSKTAEAKVGVLREPVKSPEEQVRVTRFANLLYRYIGDKQFLELAKHGARYLSSDTFVTSDRPMPGIVLALDEVHSEPIHITIVGHKDDPRSARLHAAGRRYPSLYKRIDWWDKREGALPNPDVQYPELEEPAAFACSDRICSLPVTEPTQLESVVRKMMSQTAPGPG